MIGTSVVIARTIGAGMKKSQANLYTCTILGMLIVLVVSGVGLLTQDLLFSALGAPAELLPTISSYMQIWYLFCFSSGADDHQRVLRAKGDAKTTANTMIMGPFSMPSSTRSSFGPLWCRRWALKAPPLPQSFPE